MASIKVRFQRLALVTQNDGTKKAQFLPEIGNLLDHPKLELVTFREVDRHNIKTWYVIERTSGVAITKGATRNDAVEQFDRLWNGNPEAITAAIRKSIDQYGRTPDHRITEVF